MAIQFHKKGEESTRNAKDIGKDKSNFQFPTFLKGQIFKEK